MAAGAAVVGSSAYDCRARYSNENVWARQKHVIEGNIREPVQKKLAYEQLRILLSELPAGDREMRCKAEMLYEASIRNGGSIRAAEKAIATRSFEPYAECKPESQAKEAALKWYNLAGALAFLSGSVGLVVSFFRKNEGA